MRSGSYIKAMGDDDSADSETSPKASPKSTLIAQRDAFRRSISMDHRLNDTSTVLMSLLIESLQLHLSGFKGETVPAALGKNTARATLMCQIVKYTKDSWNYGR
ncbi:hypothetical protein XENORESO_012938 [Xenotaenia resolanae]|uniref:Uncharacterized protein n=1 Tax=Xenotaenia resolanae TaxID=208358 RepID=A0ABV0VYX4_9TELE